MNGHAELCQSNGVTKNGNHVNYTNGDCKIQLIPNGHCKDNGVHNVGNGNGNGVIVTSDTFDHKAKDTQAHSQFDADDIACNDPVNSWYCLITLFATTASTMMSVGLSFGALNPIMKFLGAFYGEIYVTRCNVTPGCNISSEDEIEEFAKVGVALTVSITLLGGLVGALSLGLFLHFLTRKKSMMVINAINIIGVMLSSFIGHAVISYEVIIFGRSLMGFASGVAMNMVPMIISESSTKCRAPFYLSLIGVNLSLGGVLGITFGLPEVFGTERFWPIALSLASIPSLVYLVLSPWLPETPSYLILIGKNKKAVNTLHRLRKGSSQSMLAAEIASIRREHGQQSKSSPSLPLRTHLCNRGYLWQLFLVVMVFLGSEFCGINAITMYSNEIFIRAGIPEAQVTYASLIVYFVQFLVSLAGSAAVNKWGAKRLAVFWLTIMGLSMTLLTASAHFSTIHQPLAYVSVAAVSIYVLSWACGPNITLFPLVTALTTESTRATSFKVGGALFWISSWFVGFIPKFLMAGLNEYAYLLWTGFDLFFAVFYYFCIPETCGKTPEQIQSEIHSGINPRSQTATSNGTAMQPLQSVKSRQNSKRRPFS